MILVIYFLNFINAIWFCSSYLINVEHKQGHMAMNDVSDKEPNLQRFKKREIDPQILNNRQ